MRQRLAKIAAAVEAVLVEAAIMVAAALATNSVAGQSGDRFNSKSLRGNVTPEALISQTAVCNRLHSVEQQLCRWLLLSHDRVDTDELIMTQN